MRGPRVNGQRSVKPITSDAMTSQYERSQFDSLELTLSGIDLPSIQSKKQARGLLDVEMRKLLGRYKYILTGDASLEIEWLGDERMRYDTGRSRDVDNVIKPLIDSLYGPDRIIVDDNQIHHVGVSWIDHHDSVVNIRLSFPASDQWIPRDQIAFIHLYDNLYIPLDSGWPGRAKRVALKMLSAGRRLYRKNVEDHGYDAAKYLRPTQRLFHRGRISGFTIMNPWE